MKRRNGRSVNGGNGNGRGFVPYQPRVVDNGFGGSNPKIVHDYAPHVQVRHLFDRKPYLCAVDSHQLSEDEHARIEFALAHPELGELRRPIGVDHTALMDDTEFMFMTCPWERLHVLVQLAAERKAVATGTPLKILGTVEAGRAICRQ